MTRFDTTSEGEGSVYSQNLTTSTFIAQISAASVPTYLNRAEAVDRAVDRVARHRFAAEEVRATADRAELVRAARHRGAAERELRPPGDHMEQSVSSVRWSQNSGGGTLRQVSMLNGIYMQVTTLAYRLHTDLQSSATAPLSYVRCYKS